MSWEDRRSPRSRGVVTTGVIHGPPSVWTQAGGSASSDRLDAWMGTLWGLLGCESPPYPKRGSEKNHCLSLIKKKSVQFSLLLLTASFLSHDTEQ